MSRIGKNPLKLPAGVTFTVNGRTAVVKGPKGEVSLEMPSGVQVVEEDGTLTVERGGNSKHDRACHGMVRSILGNNVQGVVEPYSKTLEIVGVGYQANVRGRTLALKVGFANEIVLDIPEGVDVTTPSAVQIVVAGCDKQKVGHFAARTRAVRPPEPYNGKGIRYANERIQRKAGKSFASAG
jgi:large subunit ribosomal protein L6